MYLFLEGHSATYTPKIDVYQRITNACVGENMLNHANLLIKRKNHFINISKPEIELNITSITSSEQHNIGEQGHDINFNYTTNCQRHPRAMCFSLIKPAADRIARAPSMN